MHFHPHSPSRPLAVSPFPLILIADTPSRRHSDTLILGPKFRQYSHNNQKADRDGFAFLFAHGRVLGSIPGARPIADLGVSSIERFATVVCLRSTVYGLPFYDISRTRPRPQDHDTTIRRMILVFEVRGSLDGSH
jgi:hypothetical protein